MIAPQSFDHTMIVQVLIVIVSLSQPRYSIELHIFLVSLQPNNSPRQNRRKAFQPILTLQRLKATKLSTSAVINLDLHSISSKWRVSLLLQFDHTPIRVISSSVTLFEYQLSRYVQICQSWRVDKLEIRLSWQIKAGFRTHSSPPRLFN